MKYLWLIFLFAGCNDFLNTWEGYLIERGSHYSHRSGLPPGVANLFDGRHLTFQAMFFKNCIYVGDSAINKLYGFTDCNSTVHENSVRFGWRVRADSTIDIFAYHYIDGSRYWHFMGNTCPNKADDYEIWAKGHDYYFRFNEKEFITYRSKSCVHGIRERLFPYFGGSATAPHQMQIEIYESK